MESEVHRIDVDGSNTLHCREVEVREDGSGQSLLSIIQGTVADEGKIFGRELDELGTTWPETGVTTVSTTTNAGNIVTSFFPPSAGWRLVARRLIRLKRGRVRIAPDTDRGVRLNPSLGGRLEHDEPHVVEPDGESPGCGIASES